MGRDPGSLPVLVLLGNAVILPSRPKVYRKDTKVAVFVVVVLSFSILSFGARAKSFFSRVELAEIPNSLYYCIDKYAYIFVLKELQVPF